MFATRERKLRMLRLTRLSFPQANIKSKHSLQVHRKFCWNQVAKNDCGEESGERNDDSMIRWHHSSTAFLICYVMFALPKYSATDTYEASISWYQWVIIRVYYVLWNPCTEYWNAHTTFTLSSRRIPCWRWIFAGIFEVFVASSFLFSACFKPWC